VSGVSAARAAALEALRQVRRGAGFLREELHAAFDHLGLEPRDRALATQLAAGVIRHRRTLRHLLRHVRDGAAQGRPVQPDLEDILELGAFQLLFLDRVPAYAAVSEAVEAARRTARGGRGERAAGFVNGVLRGLQRLIAGHNADGRPGADAVPHPEGGVVRLTAPLLPDPARDRATFLGLAYSYPDWLVKRWLAEFGDATEAICRAGNRRPRILARLSKRVAADMAAAAQAGDVLQGAAPGPRPGCLDVTDVPAERLAPLLADGRLTIQDPSAMAAVEALAPAPGEAVLDLCASPGTKTSQTVEAMEGRGLVVACDRSEEKLVLVRQGVAARHPASVQACLASEIQAVAPPGGFDAALVDAPCTNTGVLARRPEARWRVRPEDLAELPGIQLGLLAEAAALVRPGGRLVYSTCSLQREEDDGVVAAFLAARAEWRLERRELILPSGDHDGAYWALLRR
jgi:16S rRNA (cytosine967-C5)-methyltransferase